MKSYFGVKDATKKEIKNFEKVEKLLTMEEIDIIMDALANEQTFNDLLCNKVNDINIKAIIKAHKITPTELSNWYFTEPL